MGQGLSTGAQPGGGFDADLLLRARRHAALGEPIRLAIVDHLAFGDASPGELADLVGLPTNLTAHHLRVLEHAGLIGRTRSEGDRRRSYVRLSLDDPQLAALFGRGTPPGPPPRTQASRVVFVCTRNSARSQLAAAAWRQVSGIPVASAGTHPADRVHPRAVWN
jgi:ArsR family transcriptional regulator, arsenate/arsenite/antimonite-responsive transcriptional repressor / arsenate reductase (thioredoxin)